jgi:Zn finger protein HypA/HybF involved in hydrogenase expression
MGLWRRLFRWRGSAEAKADDEEEQAHPARETNPIELPAEPFVFECQMCGKVFEARRKRPSCPECDSPEVTVLSDP